MMNARATWLVLAIIGAIYATSVAYDKVNASMSAKTARAELAAFQQMVESRPSIKLSVPEGRGTDDLLDRAGWDRLKTPAIRWEVLKRDVTRRSGFSPTHSWQPGEKAQVPLAPTP